MLVGDSLPLYVGGAPVALLSFLPTGEQHALLESFARHSPSQRYPAPPRSHIEHLIQETVLRGYSRSDEDVTLGIAALGAPVFNHRGELAAAVSVSGLRAAVLSDERATAETVVATARQISHALGFQDPR
jgi:DNA-binding IclR family transcriptional regulator